MRAGFLVEKKTLYYDDYEVMWLGVGYIGANEQLCDYY